MKRKCARHVQFPYTGKENNRQRISNVMYADFFIVDLGSENAWTTPEKTPLSKKDKGVYIILLRRSKTS